MPKSKSKRSKGLKAKAKAKPKRVSKKGLGLFHSLPYKSELASRILRGSGFFSNIWDSLHRDLIDAKKYRNMTKP